MSSLEEIAAALIKQANPRAERGVSPVDVVRAFGQRIFLGLEWVDDSLYRQILLTAIQQFEYRDQLWNNLTWPEFVIAVAGHGGFYSRRPDLNGELVVLLMMIASIPLTRDERIPRALTWDGWQVVERPVHLQAA